MSNQIHELEFTEQGSAPSNPASGNRKIYPKSGGWFELDSSGTETAIGAAGLLNKFDATAAPTVNDDTDLGYSVGSLWVDVTNDNAYQCVDNTDGAAVWLPIGGTATIIGHSIESRMDSTADYMLFYNIGSGTLNAILGQNLPGYPTQRLENFYRPTGNIESTSSTYADVDGTNIKQSVTINAGEIIEAQFLIGRATQVGGGTGTYKLVADNGSDTNPDTLVEIENASTADGVGILLTGQWTGLSADTYDIKPMFKTSSNTARITANFPISWLVKVLK